jgi:hypothetical protein
MENEYEIAIESAFEAVMEDYELDAEGSIQDMLFDMFASGFDAALELGADDEGEDD